MNRIILLFSLVLLIPALAKDSPAKKPKKEKNLMEWNGSFSPFEKPEDVIVKTDADWKALWEKLGKPAPAADFKNYFAVAVFLGTKPTGGFSVNWEPEVFSGDVGPPPLPPTEIFVRYKVKKPSGMAIEALTQPYAVKLFPKPAKDGEIKVEASHD